MADTINTCIRSLLSSRTFHDLDLVCVDGTLSYPKLLAGLVFPSLSTCNILKFPSHHTLLLPDFTVTDVMKIVETVLGNIGCLLDISELARGCFCKIDLPSHNISSHANCHLKSSHPIPSPNI